MKNSKIFTPKTIKSFSQFIDRKQIEVIRKAINEEPRRMVDELEFATPLSISQKRKLLIIVRNMFVQDLRKAFKEMDESEVLG